MATQSNVSTGLIIGSIAVLFVCMNKKFDDAEKKTSKRFDGFEKKMSDIEKKMSNVDTGVQWIMVTTPQRIDFWHQNAKNLKAPFKRPKALQNECAKHYDCYHESGHNFCQFSGFRCESQAREFDLVVVAHLLPRNLPDSMFALFGLKASEDRDGMKNVLCFARGIENSFDEKRLSFEMVDDHSKGDDMVVYRMVIWDDDVKKKQLFKKCPKTIGDVKDNLLVISKERAPLSRILSYHNYICHWNSKDRGWTDFDTCPPKLYGSPLVDQSGIPHAINIYEEAGKLYGNKLFTPVKSKQRASKVNHTGNNSQATSESTIDSMGVESISDSLS